MRELTREGILAMESGRELDQLVSEKVMGYQSYEDFPVHAIYNGLTATSFTIFQPSTDIKAAWEVVEKFTRKSELDRCGPIVELTHDGVWHMKIGINRAQGKTAPEAICKAALLAVLEATP